jgi:hypothetical protein
MTSLLYPVFLVHFTHAIWRSKQRRACWHRKRAIQAQRGGIGLPDIVEIEYVATTYLPLVRVFLKANGERAAPGFLPTRPVLASAQSPRHACWRRKQAIQAQRGGIGLPDTTEIEYIATTYLPLVRVFLKANGKRAAPGFLPTRPVLASADRLGDVQSINRDLWPQIELFRAGFAVEGSLGCPEANPPKKSGFFELFFRFSPYIIIFKKVVY